MEWRRATTRKIYAIDIIVVSQQEVSFTISLLLLLLPLSYFSHIPIRPQVWVCLPFIGGPKDYVMWWLLLRETITLGERTKVICFVMTLRTHTRTHTWRAENDLLQQLRERFLRRLAI